MAEVNNIAGPYYDKANKSWRIQWDDAAGKLRKDYSKTEDDALARYAELSGGGAPSNKLKLKRLTRGFTGSAVGLKAAIADAVRAANHAAIDGKPNALKVCRAYIATLKDASTAIVPHSEHVKLEEEHAALVQWVEDLKAGRIALEDATKQTVLSSPAATLKGRTRPDNTVH